MPRFDFANLLFSGKCNARCSFCIGKRIAPALAPPNLSAYPPRNLEGLVRAVWRYGIPRLVFTGTNTDPQLYLHEGRLLARLRLVLPPATHFSLHTNGRMALRKMETFNAYDSVTLSLPALDADIYRRVMGVPQPPDLERILRRARLLPKISIVLTAGSLSVLKDTLTRLADLGIRRVVLRKLYGEARLWERLLPEGLELTPRGRYRGNPVCSFEGMEVTLWDFAVSKSRSINLFSSGYLSERYLLLEAQEGVQWGCSASLVPPETSWKFTQTSSPTEKSFVPPMSKSI